MPKQNPLLDRSEYQDQVAVFKWAAINEHRWPCLALLFGSLMGAKLPPKYLNKYAKAGVKKGKPDINLPVPIGGHCGLWIEMKRKGGPLPTEEQNQMLRSLAAVGNAVFACRGSDAAIHIIKSYLKGAAGNMMKVNIRHRPGSLGRSRMDKEEAKQRKDMIELLWRSYDVLKAYQIKPLRVEAHKLVDDLKDFLNNHMMTRPKG